MLWVKKIIVVTLSILFSSVMLAQQHPDYKKIDSLKKLIATSNGTQRIDCLNALCEEHWWPPRVEVDSIDKWAGIANKESIKINYVQGIATSIMLFGVSEIYRKKFGTAEKYLRQALSMFETLQSDYGLGWCNVWLGQSLYSQSNFHEALSCYDKSVTHLNKVGEWDGKAKASAWKGAIYANLGNYDSSYFYCSESLQIRQKMSDRSCVAYALTNMGHLYEVAGSNEDALGYYRQAFKYAATYGVDDYVANWIYFEPVGNIYRLMNAPDSSYFYLQKALQNDPNNPTKHISFAETLLKKNEYDSALQIFLKPIEDFRKENDKWDLMRVLFDVAKTYEAKKEDKKALPYALESLSIAQLAQAKQNISDVYQVLSMLYKHLEKNDSAYFYLQQYLSLKDSLTTKQFLWRLTNYKKQTDFKRQIEQVTLLEKDNNIKEARLKNASLLKWALIIGLLLLAMSSVIVYRSLALKRKNEKLKGDREQAVLKQSATELEMQALRAQMNPHFIFNCLSSINRFILKNETEAASDYLTKFSRLIRMVLNNSNKTFITLEDELDMLRLYLDMERLRFKDSFDYSITFTNSIDVNNVFVPPLLLQPFAENAIWHGLMHKEGPGHLEIILSIKDKILTCMITDNGVGRSKAAMFKSKSAGDQKSMGLHITTERLTLLNKDMDEQTYFNFEDLTDNEGNSAGTKVILKMHYKDSMEVVV